MSVLSPRDVAASFPAAGSATGKAAHTSRRWQGWSHRLPQTGGCLQHLHKAQTTQPSALLLFSRQGQEVTGEGTHTPSASPKHQGSPSVHPCPHPGPPALPTEPLLGLAMNTPRTPALGGTLRPPAVTSARHSGSEPPSPSSCGHWAPLAAPAMVVGRGLPAHSHGWHKNATGSSGGHHRPGQPTAPLWAQLLQILWHSSPALAPGLCSTPRQGFYREYLRHDLIRRSDCDQYGVQSDKHSDQLHFTSDQHLFNPFLSIFLFSLPSPAHSPTSLGSTNNHLGFTTLSVLKCQLVCFLSLSHCLSARSVSVFQLLLLSFPFHHVWQGPWPDNLTEISVPMFPTLSVNLTYLYILLQSLTNCWLKWNQVKNTLQKYPGINWHGSLPPSILASGVLRQGLHSYSCRELLFPAFTKQLHFISMDPPERKVTLSISKECFQIKTQSRLYCNKPIKEKEKSLDGPQTKDKHVVNNCTMRRKKKNYIFSGFKERLASQCYKCFILLLNHWKCRKLLVKCSITERKDTFSIPEIYFNIYIYMPS